MRAAWYEHHGNPRESLIVGEMPDPVPGAGEVRIAVTISGVNPGDVKKRSGWQGSPMAYPRVIPHSDGAGTIDAVGTGVSTSRVGERVWCYGAQSYRPFGTAAEFVVVPDELAVPLARSAGNAEGGRQVGGAAVGAGGDVLGVGGAVLGAGGAAVGAGAPDELDEQASCLGIAGITAHRAVFADGPVDGLVVLVHGAAGGVGSIATQLARRDGATVVAVVLDDDQRTKAEYMGANHVFLNDDPALAESIRHVAPDGVHRVAEVDLAAHVDLDAEVLAIGGVICSYFSSADRPAIPYWALGFKDTALRLLGSDDFTPAVKAEAARTLTDALLDGSLRSNIVARFALEQIASAHEMVEAEAKGLVVINIAGATGTS